MYREHRRKTRAALRSKRNSLKVTLDLSPLLEVGPGYENLEDDESKEDEDEAGELTGPDEYPCKNYNNDDSFDDEPPSCAVSTHAI